MYVPSLGLGTPVVKIGTNKHAQKFIEQTWAILTSQSFFAVIDKR